MVLYRVAGRGKLGGGRKVGDSEREGTCACLLYVRWTSWVFTKGMMDRL